MSNYCYLYEPVYVVTEDSFTEPTAQSILFNNEIWSRVCD